MKNLTLLTLLLAVSAAAQTQTGHFGCKGIGQCEGQQQGQTQSGTNTLTNTNGATATTGSVSNSYQDTRQTAPAIVAPQFHTSPCVKGWGVAGQTGWAGLGFGAGKVDKGCDIRETAEQFRNAGSMTAFCKLLILEPSAKKAGVTMADCLATDERRTEWHGDLVSPPPGSVEIIPTPQAAPPPQIIVPAPQVTVNVPAPVAAPPVKHMRHIAKPCPEK